MKAVVLAAGVGRRMLPLTADTPKTMLKVADRPIINWIVDGLLANNIVDIVVVTGYHAERIERHLSTTYAQASFRFIRNEDYATTNNVYSLALALEQLVDCPDDILVLESDVVFEPAVVTSIVEDCHANVALVDEYRLGLDGTVVELRPDGIVDRVIPATRQGARFDYSDMFKTLNIYKISAAFRRKVLTSFLSHYSRSINDSCFYEVLLGVLIYLQEVEVYALRVVDRSWAEIDDANDLAAAERLFSLDARLHALDAAWGGYWTDRIVDFNLLHNARFPPGSLLSHLRARVSDLVQCYPSNQAIVDGKVAHLFGSTSNNFCALNGASQLYSLPLWSDFGYRRALIPDPTFGEYRRWFDDVRTYPDNGHVSLELLRAGAKCSDVVVIVNPNNPTGTVIRRDDTIQLVRDHPSTSFVVDESFIEFSDELSVIPWLETSAAEVASSRVLVVKSLGKSLGVPGLRLGIVFTKNKDWLNYIRSMLPIWNVNSFAEHFLELVLKYPQQREESFALTKGDRALLAKRLAGLPIVKKVFPSGGNFLLVQLACTVRKSDLLRAKMLSRYHILLRDVSVKFAEGSCYWRVAVKSPAENQFLCAALEQLSNDDCPV